MNADEVMAAIKASGKLHYVYVLHRSSGEPFYVGVGTGRRILDHEMAARRTRKQAHRLAVIRQMARDGEALDYRLSGCFDDWQSAARVEQGLVQSIGRRDIGTGPLTNMSDGGEGCPNPSAETRASRGWGCREAWSRRDRQTSTAHLRDPEVQKRAASARVGRTRKPYDWKGPKGWKACPVEVRGVVYPSIKDAAVANGLTDMSIHKWLRTGKHGARRLSISGAAD